MAGPEPWSEGVPVKPWGTKLAGILPSTPPAAPHSLSTRSRVWLQRREPSHSPAPCEFPACLQRDRSFLKWHSFPGLLLLLLFENRWGTMSYGTSSHSGFKTTLRLILLCSEGQSFCTEIWQEKVKEDNKCPPQKAEMHSGPWQHGLASQSSGCTSVSSLSVSTDSMLESHHSILEPRATYHRARGISLALSMSEARPEPLSSSSGYRHTPCLSNSSV